MNKITWLPSARCKLIASTEIFITMEVCDEMVHEIVLKAAKLHSSFKYTDKVN
jgi:hypothetical protein